MNNRRVITTGLVVLLLTMTLSGCSESTDSSKSYTESDSSVIVSSIDSTDENEEIVDETSQDKEEEDTTEEAIASEDEDGQEEELPETEETPTIAEEYGLTEQQKNSVSMLYYLAITAEKIRTSKDNRLILDDIYTSLLNDINPGSIDETTQDHLRNLRDIIKAYLNISVKRERLQYIYNQNKAAAIRSAVPNPLAILSLAQTMDWKKLAMTAVYTVVDSYTSYKNASDSADQEFLMSGWELDDAETEAIQKNRDRAFDYMVDIVQEYGFNGKLTLSENDITKYNEICAIDSPKQKIRRLETEEKKYSLLGDYWLELADCYFETSQYQKCLDAIQKYNELANDIYRQDYNYVRMLPKAIVAAQDVYSEDDKTYVGSIDSFVQSIIDNTSTEDWSLRYFAAQVYLDLYKKTNQKDYMEKAYNIAFDNVTVLLDEQKKINRTYLEDVEEVTISEPDTRFMKEKERKEAEKEYKEEKKRLKEYNKGLKETRKTELPTLFEPLIINCDLLFSLAEELGIDDAEKQNIEDILQTGKNGVFLSKPVNNHYSFSKSADECNLTLSSEKIVIPAEWLAKDSRIIITIIEGNKSEVFEDCTVSNVDRKGKSFDSFLVELTSNTWKKYKWTDSTRIRIKVINENAEPFTVSYRVTEIKKQLIGQKVVFEKE